MIPHKLLAKTLDALQLTPRLRPTYSRPCAARLSHYLRNPGDCAGDVDMLIGLAIASHEVPQSPEWIPEVQKRAYEYAKVAEQIRGAAGRRCTYCSGTGQIVADHSRYGPEVQNCPDCSTDA